MSGSEPVPARAVQFFAATVQILEAKRLVTVYYERDVLFHCIQTTCGLEKLLQTLYLLANKILAECDQRNNKLDQLEED